MISSFFFLNADLLGESPLDPKAPLFPLSPVSPLSPLRNLLRPSTLDPRESKSNIFPVAKSMNPAATLFNPCGFSFSAAGSTVVFSFASVLASSPPDVGVIIILPPSSIFNMALGDPPITSSCGSTLDSVVSVVDSVSSFFTSSCSSFSGLSSFRLRFLFSIILSSLWNLSMISLNLSPSILSAPFFF